jgi:hypothetical protein
MAALMKELTELSQSDPAKFKEVTARISEKLKTAAQQASGGEADLLQELSDKFSEASSSGEMSAVRPSGPPPGGGPGGQRGASAASTAYQNAPQPPPRRGALEDIIQSALAAVTA